MNYFKYVLLAGILVLTGAGCGLQQPEPVEDTSKDSATSQALKAENDRLKKENEKLKKTAEKEDDKKKEEKEDDEKTSDNEKDSDKMEDEETSTDPQGRKVLGDIGMEADENSIVVLLTGDAPYTKGEAFIEYGCDSVLVPVKVELEKSQSDLATAIVQLLTIKKAQFEDQELTNSLSGIGLTLANVAYEEGKRIIEFEGEPKLTGICEDERIQAQLEETIKLYSDNFEIRLNGSADEWVNTFKLGDE